MHRYRLCYLINSNWLISSIKLRLNDQFKQDWYSLIEHSPKALNYRIFKENFEFENYFRILEDIFYGSEIRPIAIDRSFL
jgi:hypothetical protein